MADGRGGTCRGVRREGRGDGGREARPRCRGGRDREGGRARGTRGDTETGDGWKDGGREGREKKDGRGEELLFGRVDTCLLPACLPDRLPD